jgi:sec-independent protein translocase protein TatC
VARLKAARFEDRLTLVEHLGELRTRIIVSLAAFGVAFALCFWQDDLMLEIANWPLPQDNPDPITFSPTEPFFTTVEVSAYGALVISLPVILYQVYAFVLPAFSPREQRTLLPFIVAMPLLFGAGVAFAYFLVLPAATQFLLNFNASEFNIQVRAREYYSFFGITLVALGLLFQIPIVMLSLTRLEIVTAEWFAKNRRYAIFVISVVAAAAPGGDPVSMIMIMIPLVVLYEASIVIARRFGAPRAKREAPEPDLGPSDTPAPGAG